MRIFLNLDGKERPYESMAGAYMALVKKLNIRVADPKVSSQLGDANYPMILNLFWEAWKEDPKVKIRIEKGAAELEAERFILKVDTEELEFSAKLWKYSDASAKIKHDADSILRGLRGKLNVLYNAIEKYNSMVSLKEYHAYDGSHDAKVAKFIYPRYVAQERTIDGTILAFDTDEMTPVSEIERQYDETEEAIASIKDMLEEIDDIGNPIDVALMSRRLNLGYTFIQVYEL